MSRERTSAWQSQKAYPCDSPEGGCGVAVREMAMKMMKGPSTALRRVQDSGESPQRYGGANGRGGAPGQGVQGRCDFQHGEWDRDLRNSRRNTGSW